MREMLFWEWQFAVFIMLFCNISRALISSCHSHRIAISVWCSSPRHLVLWVARNPCRRNFHTNPAYCHNRLVWINIRSPSDAIFHPMKSKIFRLFIVRLWMGEWDCNENDAAHLGACCGIIEFILCVFLKRFWNGFEIYLTEHLINLNG